MQSFKSSRHYDPGSWKLPLPLIDPPRLPKNTISVGIWHISIAKRIFFKRKMLKLLWRTYGPKVVWKYQAGDGGQDNLDAVQTTFILRQGFPN